MSRAIAILLAVSACGGGHDAALDATGVDAPAIAGGTPFSARWLVVAYTDETLGVPVAGGAARLETHAGAFLESTTDASGNVTFMVDPTTGPFALTFAKAGEAAISILDVATSVGDVYTRSLASPTVTYQGAITGKTTGADRVAVSTYGGYSVTTTAAAYELPVTSTGAPQRVVALELDPRLVPVSITSATSASGTADLAFPTPPPLAPVQTTATVHLPTTGAVTNLKRTASNGVFGAPCPVALLQAQPGAVFGDRSLYAVGCGTTTVPDAAGTATLTMYGYAGDFAPTRAATVYSSSSGAAAVVTIVPGAPTLELPPADAFEVTGTSLGNLRWSAAGAGYTESQMIVLNANGDLLWTVFGPPVTHGATLPALPSTVAFHDITAETAVGLELDLRITASGKPDYQPTLYIELEALFLLPPGVVATGR